jgi:leucyl/phenylalanyl-tRNA---protein transferase
VVNEKRELVGFSKTIDADDMLAGYRRGMFAMSHWGLLYQWWSPDPRGVLPLDNLKVTRSLRKSARRYTVTLDTAFEEVLARCADPSRFGGWIDPGLEKGYLDLHHRGYAHSVEARDASGQVVGGLFGVCIGGFFSGESMFHTATDASKVALMGLVERLQRAQQPILLDTQWRTEHLTSLGVIDVRRTEYLRQLAAVVNQPNAL